MRRLALLVVTGLVLAGCSTRLSPRSADAPGSWEASVRAFADEFVAAFNALDQQRFDALWATDATVFFPQPPFPIRRVDGRAEVLAWFKRFFDDQRGRGASPGIDPKDLAVIPLGPDHALIHFHLGTDAERVARRTLVLRREPPGWRILHLHASSLTAPAAGAR